MFNRQLYFHIWKQRERVKRDRRPYILLAIVIATLLIACL